jgi:class 3 adenylate cyclase
MTTVTAPSLPFDPSTLSMTEIVRLQNQLSQELARRFETSAALLFTDVAGSTPYFARFGDEAGRRLQQLHLDLLAAGLAAHGGRIVDTAGDGAFSCFGSAEAAAKAVRQLLAQVTEANRTRGRDHQLALHVGLHWGRVLSDGTLVTGDAVNLCARIASSCEPGQVRLSLEAFQQLSPALRLMCRPLGAMAFKGVGREVEVMALDWRDPARFPTEVVLQETGQTMPLPPRDIIAFGRLDMIEGMSANDIVLALPDPDATRQISRWHFELHRRANGYLLRAVSSQATLVDGVVAEVGQDVPVRPGSVVQVSGVLTLRLQSPRGAGAEDDERTLLRVR